MNILEWKRNIWICMGKHENHANGLRARTLWIWIHRNEKGDRFENGAESDMFNVCASTESMNLDPCMF